MAISVRGPWMLAETCPYCSAVLGRHELPLLDADAFIHGDSAPFVVSRFDMIEARSPQDVIDKWFLTVHPERRPHPMDVEPSRMDVR